MLNGIKRTAWALGMLVLFAAAAIAQIPAAPRLPVSQIEKKGYLQKRDPPGSFSLASPNFRVHYYRMHWNIDPAVRAISGAVTSHFTMLQPGNQLTYDLDNSLLVDSVLFSQSQVSFVQKENKTVEISLPVSLNAGALDSLTIYYHGVPPQNGFGSFVQSTHGSGVPVLWTLSEPYGAKEWWPCRNGLDDKADSIDLYITHPAIYSASANGVLVSTITAGNFTTSFFKHRYPIATYLVGIAVTNYVQFSQTIALQSGNMPVTNTVYPEALEYFKSNMQPLYNALQLYDLHLGTYPFVQERYGQTQFSWGGGMEHQTNSFVVSADEYLMAHELAHQWFGNKITCGSWQDIWLNEGFATYFADIFYTEHFNPAHLPAVVAEDLSNILAEPHGSVWVDDTTSIDRIFSNNLSYKKGAFLLRMLRRTLGDGAFFDGLHRYQQDTALAYRFARTADLQRHMEAASGKNLTYFFDQWFYGKGYPSVEAAWLYNNGVAEITIGETTSDNSVSFFKMPLEIVFKRGTQQYAATVEVNSNNQRFSLPIPFVPDTVLIDPSQYFITYNNRATKVTSLPPAPPLSIFLYPNPVRGVLFVRTNEAAPATLRTRVVNSAGITVLQRQVTLQNNASFSLPVNNLSAGLYFLQVENGDGKISTQKFIKY